MSFPALKRHDTAMARARAFPLKRALKIDLLSSVPSFNVKADVDKDGNVTLKTPMSVEVTGDRLGDVLYTVYSYDGKVLAKESKKLELPKEDIDGCLVKIKITWGKKDTSYLEEDYWFAAMYNTER